MEYNHDGGDDEPDSLYTGRNDAVNAGCDSGYAVAANSDSGRLYGSECGNAVRNDTAICFSAHKYDAGGEYRADADDGHSDSGANRSNTGTDDHHNDAESNSGDHDIDHEHNTFYRHEWNE